MVNTFVIFLAVVGLCGAWECGCGESGKCSLTKEMIAANRESFCLLGLKSGYIPNHAMSASSYFGDNANNYLSYIHGRLDTPYVPTEQNGGWSAKINAVGQWIQVDLFKPTKIFGVITQGRNGVNQWVTKYNIFYLPPYSTTWKTVKGLSGNDANFTGNYDSDTKVTKIFHEPIVTTKLRLVVQQWRNHISLRHEYLVC